MSENPAGAERLSRDDAQYRPPWGSRAALDLPGGGSVRHKTVRSGSLEPAHVTLAKRTLLPLVAVLMLAVCVLACGRTLSSQFCAVGLAAFLIAAQVFSPMDLQNSRGAERTGKTVSRILLEWSCVAAILVFLSASLNLTHIFSRDIILSWFLLTPIALLLVDSRRAQVARWLAADRGMVQRYIIIGANDVGAELARRIETSHAREKFFGFLDFRSADARRERTRQVGDGQLLGARFCGLRPRPRDQPRLSGIADFHRAAHRGAAQGIARYDRLRLLRP